MTLQECIDRTMEQREKFAALPETSIKLNVVMAHKDVYDERRSSDEMRGTAHTPCNSVGCIEGWIDHDLYARGTRGGAYEYMGIEDYCTPGGDRLFIGRLDYHISEREEGLARYDRRLEELRALTWETTA